MGNTLRRIRELGFAMTLALAAVLAFGTVVAAPASALDTPTISGVVYGHSTEGIVPLAETRVAVEIAWTGQHYAVTQTDANGRYSLPAPVAGQYKVEFGIYYRPPVIYLGQSQTITAGTENVTLDATLEKESTITGTATQILEGVAAPARGAGVFAYLGSQMVSWAVADADGAYALSGLAAGTYTVGFDTYNSGGGYIPEYYGDASTRASARTVEVGPAVVVPNIDATLMRGSIISGKVTKQIGSTVSDAGEIYVYVRSADGDNGSAQTKPDGSYSIGSLKAGTYTVGFQDSYNDLVREYYVNAPDLASATPVEVGVSQTVAGIDALLVQASTITGTVSQTIGGATTRAEGVSIQAMSSTGESLGNGWTDENGSYEIKGLAAGDIRLSFSKGGSGLVSEFYANAATLAASTPVAVGTGITIAGINATLEAGGTISGTISSPAGALNGYAVAYSLQNGQWAEAGAGWTTTGGRYVMEGLRTGSYKVGFSDYSSGTSFEPEYYNDVHDLASAQTVVVGDGASVTGISAVLNPIGSVPTLVATTPTISGTAIVGSVLTANSGAWTPSTVALGYQWYRSGAAVTGATAKTLTLTPSDLGRTMTVKVTGSQSGYLIAAATSAATAAIAAAPTTLTAPVPTITGTLKGGNVLTANSGTWAPATVTLAYQWYRTGVAISGATAKTYTLTATDVGTRMTVKVTGSKTGYTTAAKTSASTVAITTGTLTSAVPTITGTKKVGSVLTASAGTWGPGTVTMKYQWYRTGVLITGATAKTYKLVAADLARTMTVKVTGSKSGATTVAKTSVATTAVVAGTLTTATPTLTGTVKVGSVLTANPGTWGPATVTLKYQWYRTGVAITGATAKTYALTSTDRTKTMTVKVTGSKSGYTTASKTSAATVAVAAGTLTTATPTITGTLKSGYTLTANPGTWGPATVTLKYQWYRSGVAISGATLKTYTLVSADRADTIKVRVVGSKTGYTSVTKYSASTVKIP